MKRYPFTTAYEAKGYTRQSLSERWGIGLRQITNIAKDPKQYHLDALDNGLPDLTESSDDQP